MSGGPGSFVWYELMTGDPAAAKTFYGAVAGWTFQDVPMPNMTYTLVHADGVQVGGIMPIPEEAAQQGAGPVWFGYVGVDDVDAAARSVEAAGGSIHRAPTDIPNVGRFAMVADPQGAVFALFQGNSDQPSRAFELGTPGHFGWNELHTRDGAAALDFYVGQFGWARAEPMNMGEMGYYRIFEIDGAGAGATMDSPNFPRPMWLFYICVPDIDAALDKARSGGAEIMLEPIEVPGGMWIVQAKDPQGAMFALVGPRK